MQPDMDHLICLQYKGDEENVDISGVDEDAVEVDIV